MRAVLVSLILLTAHVAASGPATPVGTWNQFDDRKGDLRSVVRIDLVDGELVGTIVKAVLRPDEPPNPTCDKCPNQFKDKPIEGLRFMWGLKGAGRQYDGGRILDPENGKIYRVKLSLSDDGQRLDVRGYVGFSLLGRTQRWVRAQP